MISYNLFSFNAPYFKVFSLEKFIFSTPYVKNLRFISPIIFILYILQIFSIISYWTNYSEVFIISTRFYLKIIEPEKHVFVAIYFLIKVFLQNKYFQRIFVKTKSKALSFSCLNKFTPFRFSPFYWNVKTYGFVVVSFYYYNCLLVIFDIL